MTGLGSFVAQQAARPVEQVVKDVAAGGVLVGTHFQKRNAGVPPPSANESNSPILRPRNFD
jgi:hypothetical protein